VELASETLHSTAKDLLVAARLAEALVKLHGLAGLREGLGLLHQLTDQCWDSIYPPIEDGDLEVRASPFNWLDDPFKGARFPSTIRLVPLVFGESRGFAYWDWSQARETKDAALRMELDKAIKATTTETLSQELEDCTQSLDELTRLGTLLNDKLGKDAPGFTSLRPAMEDCRNFLQQILQQRPLPDRKADKPPSEEGVVEGAGGPPVTRADAYRQLAEAADILQALEPHSPIPYLVRRAVELGSLPFPQLIQELVREPNILKELNREFGIKEPKSASEDGSSD
jgi:type VI secretion system protein ImpA